MRIPLLDLDSRVPEEMLKSREDQRGTARKSRKINRERAAVERLAAFSFYDLNAGVLHIFALSDEEKGSGRKSHGNNRTHFSAFIRRRSMQRR